MRHAAIAAGLALIVGAGCDRESPSPTPPATAAPEPPKPAAEHEPLAEAPKPEPAPVAEAPKAEPTPDKPAGSPPTKAAATTKSVAKTPAPPQPAPSAAPARAVKTVSGSGASGEGFAVSISAPSPVRSGQTSSAVVVLSAKDPYKCNDKYPYKFVLDAPSSGVSYPQPTVRGMAVAEKRSSMSVPFTVAAAGPATIAGQLHFSICTADKCLIEKRKLSVTVQAD